MKLRKPIDILRYVERIAGQALQLGPHMTSALSGIVGVAIKALDLVNAERAAKAAEQPEVSQGRALKMEPAKPIERESA